MKENKKSSKGMNVMSYNPYEAELHRLTINKARLRVLIDTTKDMKKKEEYRKRYETTTKQLEEQLKWINIFSS